jgi:hypothetical protein
MHTDNVTANLERRTYDFLKEEFGAEVITNRCESIEIKMNAFLRENGWNEEDVHVSKSLIAYAVYDYFSDISRVKSFHKIEKINDVKILSYTAYWLLRKRPIQILRENTSTPNNKLSFINERFILFFLIHGMLGENDLGILSETAKKNFLSLTDTLYYYLVYRRVDPQSLELMITAFAAGRTFYVEKSAENSATNEVGTTKSNY